jgi:flagellar biosynthesis protein
LKRDPKERLERAVALRYELEKDDAPRVVAKGRGEVAKRIIEIAKEHGVTVYEDDDLVEVLSRLDLNQLIPPELYQAIAEVLAFVYRVNGRATSLLAE